MFANAPSAAPPQYVPLMAMSTCPRYFAGMRLVDRRVDRRVLAADAQPRDEPEGRQEPEVLREARDARTDQVDRERQDEQLAPPQSVGHAPEHQGTDDLADQVDRAEGRHLLRGQVQVRLEARVRDDLDLETVEDPGHAESDDDAPVEPGPRQAVHPGGHQALDGCVRAAHEMGPYAEIADVVQMRNEEPGTEPDPPTSNPAPSPGSQ